VTPEDRRRLEAIILDRSAPQKHVWRAEIILATADGYGTTGIMRRSWEGQTGGVDLAGAVMMVEAWKG
jgi:hypothetical protein